MPRKKLTKWMERDSHAIVSATKIWTRFLVIAACSIAVSACTNLGNQTIVDPKDVTISEALKDIGGGFADLGKTLGDKKLGVFVCKITMKFNVKASESQEGKLVLDLPQIIGTKGSAKVEHGSDSDAERGNVVNLEMYNPGCLPNNTLGFDKPEKVSAAAEGMKLEGQATIQGGPTKDVPSRQ